MAHVSKTSKFQNTESKKSHPPVTCRISYVSCVFCDIFFGGKNKWSLAQILWKKSLRGTKILKNEGLWGPWGHFGMPLGLQGAKRGVPGSFWASFCIWCLPWWHILLQKGSPWPPPGSQNWVKIVPKSLQISFQIPLGFLSRVWTIWGSILAPIMETSLRLFQDVWRKAGNLWTCFLTTVPHESPLYEGPRAWNFEKNEAQDPFGMFFVYLIFGSVFVLFWEPVWSILEAKIVKNVV